MPRIVILTEGKSTPDDAKTATGLLRYRPGDVAAVLDSTRAGKTAGEVLGTGGDIPIVAKLGAVKADTLLIGIAPAGGKLPRPWRAVIREAIARGMDVVSGLHYFLNEDPEFAALAKKHRVRLTDVRQPPAGLTVSKDLARNLRCHRVHTVGHDCSVGKMVASLELANALGRRGRRAEFVATGQTGIMISGWGVCVDRVISDFVAGAIEAQVLAHQDAEFLLVEGQGSLIHPLYSGVTLGLLHGCAPQTMVMVYDPTRKRIKHTEQTMPPLAEVIRLYEDMASIMTPSKVAAVAANTYRLSQAEAEKAVRRTEDQLGIPVADVIREGSDRLVDALLARHRELGLERAGPAGKRRQGAAIRAAPAARRASRATAGKTARGAR
jgi:uncharacterized NAD-dependent epimerase/dehydratase family protein